MNNFLALSLLCLKCSHHDFVKAALPETDCSIPMHSSLKNHSRKFFL